MSRRHRLALRTEAVIEHMHARGISAESIAGETRVRLDRVVAHIATLTSVRAERMYARAAAVEADSRRSAPEAEESEHE
jgi:hypothetical protein